MDVAGLVNLIGSLGFPIVMCILLWSQMQKNEERHKEELEKITEAIQNNTIAVVEWTTLLKSREDNAE